MMVSFVLSFFPRDVLDEILNLIESVSEDFPSYFYMTLQRSAVDAKEWQGYHLNNCRCAVWIPYLVILAPGLVTILRPSKLSSLEWSPVLPLLFHGQDKPSLFQFPKTPIPYTDFLTILGVRSLTS